MSPLPSIGHKYLEYTDDERLSLSTAAVKFFGICCRMFARRRFSRAKRFLGRGQLRFDRYLVVLARQEKPRNVPYRTSTGRRHLTCTSKVIALPEKLLPC